MDFALAVVDLPVDLVAEMDSDSKKVASEAGNPLGDIRGGQKKVQQLVAVERLILKCPSLRDLKHPHEEIVVAYEEAELDIVQGL